MSRLAQANIAATAIIGFPGTVVSTSYTGDQISYRIDVRGQTIDAERSSAGATILAPGTPVEVSWDAADVRILEG
ncbi:TOBE domain-containing protein [Nonomuraea sp. NPDC050153]|uniref:TOBE domain-containing protein n=1 Tax=Nonomuraea sp. NPDC050153 TaxID=3364359 RepID=UPI00379819C7